MCSIGGISSVCPPTPRIRCVLSAEQISPLFRILFLAMSLRKNATGTFWKRHSKERVNPKQRPLNRRTKRDDQQRLSVGTYIDRFNNNSSVPRLWVWISCCIYRLCPVTGRYSGGSLYQQGNFPVCSGIIHGTCCWNSIR